MKNKLNKKINSAVKKLATTLGLGTLAFNLFSPKVQSRLPDPKAFYTQDLSGKIDTTLALGPNTKIQLKGSTHMFDIYIDTIRVKQKFNYEVGKDNKIDLFEANTNLKFSAYLNIGKDTLLTLISNPLDRLVAIDTIKINGKRITIKDKVGRVLEEDLKTILNVKKIDKNKYDIEFGFEKYLGNSPISTLKLLNLILNYTEAYERHLNVIIGRFKNDPIQIPAYKGKNAGLDAVFEPVDFKDRIEFDIVYAPKFENDREIYGDDLTSKNIKRTDLPRRWAFISPKWPPGTGAMEWGHAKKIIVRVGEEYNKIELDYEEIERTWDKKLIERIADMGYIIFSKIDGKAFECDYHRTYPWPGVWIRGPPSPGFFFVSSTAYYFIPKQLLRKFDTYNAFTFMQIYYEKYNPPTGLATDTSSQEVRVYQKRDKAFFLFGAIRGEDGVYRWIDTTVRIYIRDILDVTNLNDLKTIEYKIDTTLIPLDSVPIYTTSGVFEYNKLKVEFPDKERKTVIIWDENPVYKTIARDGFIKVNSLYAQKDTIKAELIKSIPFNGETGVDKKTYITLVFNEKLLEDRVSWEVKENGELKEGGYVFNNDSTISWFGKEFFNLDSKIDWKVEVYDIDTNKTIATGYFYTQNPAKVEQESQEFLGPAKLYDLLGRVIKTYDKEEKIDLEQLKQLPLGTYVIAIENKEKYEYKFLINTEEKVLIK